MKCLNRSASTESALTGLHRWIAFIELRRSSANSIVQILLSGLHHADFTVWILSCGFHCADPLCGFYLSCKFHRSNSVTQISLRGFCYADSIDRILSCGFHCANSIMQIPLCRFHCADSIVQIPSSGFRRADSISRISSCGLHSFDYIESLHRHWPDCIN